MTTNDLSQCKNCIYHYTYNGKDMCKQVGEDFYLQWKVEDCPYHTTITSATKISDEIYRLKAENAALRERLGKWAVDNEIVMEPRVKDGKIYYVISRKERRIVTHYICTELTPEAAEARLKELKGGKE